MRPPTESTSFAIRLASPTDAAACLAIYAPCIRDTVISFEIEVPSLAEFEQRIGSCLQSHPWLVAVEADTVLGYAYAGTHRTRQAYQWSVEVSAYVDARVHRRGIGRRLYRALFACLRRQGFHNAFAGITLPNDASVGLHRALGFRPIGVFEAIGFKHGAWHGVEWSQLRLSGDGEGPPYPPPAAAPQKLDACRSEIVDLLGHLQH